MSNLIDEYTERFCQEFNSPNIKVRRKEVRGFVDGEDWFGPSEVWPVPISSYSYGVYEHHSHRDMDYETLKKIVLLEFPKALKKSYISKEHYWCAVNEMFRGTLIGMKAGKLERVFNRKLEKYEENEVPSLLRPFLKKSSKRKVASELKTLIDSFKRSVPSWYGIKNHLSFSDALS